MRLRRCAATHQRNNQPGGVVQLTAAPGRHHLPKW
nr:MAG TPA: hypothetical protein [Caudoviricetes sp.]